MSSQGRAAELQHPGGGPTEHQPPMQIQFTPEERKVMQECRREAFWYRAVPLMAVLAGGTHIGVQRGFIKSSPRFGASLKVLGASFVGYIVGVFSYQSECNKKILRLENSPYAEALRSGKRGQQLLEAMSRPRETDTPHSSQQPLYSNSNVEGDYSSSISIDTSSNVQSQGLDDSLRPNLDTSQNGSLDKQNIPATEYTSYDDLRKRNRQNYDQRVAEYNSRVAVTDAQPGHPSPLEVSEHQPQSVAPPSSSLYSSGVETKRQSASDSPPERSKRQRRNQYGDIVD